MDKMKKTKKQILKERRTFKEKTSLGEIQDRLTEIELRLDVLEGSE